MFLLYFLFFPSRKWKMKKVHLFYHFFQQFLLLCFFKTGGFLATRRGYSKCKEKYALINSNTSWVPGVGSARVTLSSSPLALSVLGKNLAGKGFYFYDSFFF